MADIVLKQREAAFGKAVTLYPNPASSTLTVAPEGGAANDLQAQLYNPLGQPVAAAASLHPSVPAELDLSGLAAGIYFLKVTGSGVMATQRVVVTH